MSEHTKLFVGAQNDALYIIAGRAPSKDNDYPVHDAARTVIAKVYEEAYAQFLVDAYNAHESLVAALKKLELNLTEAQKIIAGQELSATAQLFDVPLAEARAVIQKAL